jgi:hypothetical protein
MATHLEDDDEGAPTQPSPSADEAMLRALADLVLAMRGIADELHELRVTWRKTGLTPQARAALAGALRRLGSQVGFVERAVAPPPPRKPRPLAKVKRP